MVRPKCCRKIGCLPSNQCFKPEDTLKFELEKVILSLDELESIKLMDLEGMYQIEAAKHMGVARTTFGRIIKSAHKKIADALIEGKALKIEGGKVAIDKHCKCKKKDCCCKKKS